MSKGALLSQFLGKKRAKYIIIKIRLKFRNSLKCQIEPEWNRYKTPGHGIEDIGVKLTFVTYRYVTLSETQFLCMYNGIMSLFILHKIVIETK